MQKINREELLKALSKLGSGLSEKQVLEQSDSFTFSDGRVYTYNDEVWVSIPCQVEGEFSVKSKELLSILGKLKGEQSKVEARDTELYIRDGKAQSGVVLNKEIAIPVKELKKDKKWQDLPDGFADGVVLCSHSCSKDMSKPVLTCIHIKGDYIEACDIYTLTRYTMSGKMREIIIPSDIVKELERNDFQEYSITKGWVHFKDEDNLIFSSRTFKAKYPDLTELLEMDEGFDVELPKELVDLLSKASVFSKSKYEEDNLVDITMSSKRIVVRGEGKSGWFEEKSVIKTKIKEELEFTVNPNSLSQVLKLNRTVNIQDNKIVFESDNVICALVI